MKYLTLLLLCSCTISQGDRVQRITKSKEYPKSALYEVYDGGSFYAPIGLYNVGDTVKFTK